MHIAYCILEKLKMWDRGPEARFINFCRMEGGRQHLVKRASATFWYMWKMSHSHTFTRKSNDMHDNVSPLVKKCKISVVLGHTKELRLFIRNSSQSSILKNPIIVLNFYCFQNGAVKCYTSSMIMCIYFDPHKKRPSLICYVCPLQSLAH